ncbi:lytic transglycosylase domain-containing protein [Nocardioides yefusunii]|uniref:Lytic transglycosylase domain-containing protein n=1 Tax=Nocardioides yefusunii TaxID=2500546 RepID=A0ABW1QXC5_9ACTN|nr:lytic murein transglycosylase [Nocardioides yefusunii]
MKKSVLVAGTAGLGGLVLAGVLAVSSGLVSTDVLDRVQVPGAGTDSAVLPLADDVDAPLYRAPAASRGANRVPTVDSGWVRRTAEATGIPEPAVRAYGTAVLNLPDDGCALGWTTLAGIGWVESQHGTIDGRTLGDDGRSSEAILGPALNGVDFAAIPATAESTLMHGDPTWDHAVGPMQFIPSTWKRWGRDGDGDGVADPHDLDDAAASTAAYLCHDGHDLATSSGWNAAVFSYNHENAYVVSVFEAADRYGRATS